MAEPLLTVFAEMHARPGKEDELRRALIGMIEPTRREAGCVQYDLHVGYEDPRHYFFYENWTSREGTGRASGFPAPQSFRGHSG